MKCFRCGAQVIWGADFTYQDYGIDETDGIVSNFTCPYCNSYYEVYTPINSENNNTIGEEKKDECN